MRILIAMFDRLLDWAFCGGFGRFAYKTMAFAFAVAIVGEVATNGLTDTVYLYGLLLAGMLVYVYDL